MALNFILFVANLLIAGVFIRFLESKMAGTSIGAALSYAY